MRNTSERPIHVERIDVTPEDAGARPRIGGSRVHRDVIPILDGFGSYSRAERAVSESMQATVERMPPQDNPAALSEYDPRWPVLAQQMLAAIRERLRDLPGISTARFDHIGSTSVPGLAAKPIIDLQVSILPLPPDGELGERLGPLGYHRARGSRPDSLGVYRDLPRGSAVVDDDVWVKSLFVNEDGTVILHIRRGDSPWASFTVWFRDWLKAHPTRRQEYETIKRDLSAKNIGKPDYDDYTRAKTAFLDQVQEEFEQWAAH